MYRLFQLVLFLKVTSLKTGVYALYAGGDQTFIMSNGKDVTTPDANSMALSPRYEMTNGDSNSLDYRVLDSSKQILTITAKLVQQLCAASEPVDQDLMTLVEVVFASPACWNASFIIPDNNAPCTYKNIGIDLSAVSAHSCVLKSRVRWDFKFLLNVTGCRSIIKVGQYQGSEFTRTGGLFDLYKPLAQIASSTKIR